MPKIALPKIALPKIALPMRRWVQKAGYPQAVQQLKQETRKLLGLSNDVAISVTELSCSEPGCPDVETVVAILREREKPILARIHKSIPDITPDELEAAFKRDLGA
jgi:hypothetical protein